MKFEKETNDKVFEIQQKWEKSETVAEFMTWLYDKYSDKKERHKLLSLAGI